MYALQIERVYTKEQIMTLYCNQIFLGGGAYGVEAAANYYFSKSVKDLSLDQYALLAALPKAPSAVLARAHTRRRRGNAATSSCRRWPRRATSAGARPRQPRRSRSGSTSMTRAARTTSSPYAYFVEEVRQELQRLLLSRSIRRMPWTSTARDSASTRRSTPRRSEQATEAVRKGLRQYERRHGWRAAKFGTSLEQPGTSLDATATRLVAPGPEGRRSFDRARPRGRANAGRSFRSAITRRRSRPARRRSTGRPPTRLFKRGDLAEFTSRRSMRRKSALTVKLEPEPEVQGALVLLDAKTGEIKAMVGGYDFATSKFNHATQANRQTGSAFKPFIYAAALEQGLKPDDIVDDAPFKRGNWEPHNYDNRSMGAMPLKRGARAFAQHPGGPRARRDRRQQGDAGRPPARAAEPDGAFPAFGARGDRGAAARDGLGLLGLPQRRRARRAGAHPAGSSTATGSLLDEAKPKSYKVLTDYVAAQMVEHDARGGPVGTATAAGLAGRELAGKTGTVNDFTDAWFIGYTPSVVCGVWIGYDEKKTLGKGESGSSAAALPFWIDFMQPVLQG